MFCLVSPSKCIDTHGSHITIGTGSRLPCHQLLMVTRPVVHHSHCSATSRSLHVVLRFNV